MYAWICPEPTGVSALRWVELPTPNPANGEVCVRIIAAGLNYPDRLIIENKYQIKPPLPFIPGAEFSGIVEEVGENVTSLTIGQHVACFVNTGAFATHIVVPATSCFILPQTFPIDTAAAFILTYATSYHALIDQARLTSSDTILILGASGGVGTAAIQIAKQLGAYVIAAASTDDKCEYCIRQGSDEVINYSDQDFQSELKQLTKRRPISVVYDPVGGELAEAALRRLDWAGRYLVVGFASGKIPSFPANLPLLKGASIIGVFWGEFQNRHREHNKDNVSQIVEWILTEKLNPQIDTRLAMRQLPLAYERLDQRNIKGKLILVNES